MTKFLVILLIVFVIGFIFFEYMSIQAKQLLNDNKCIIEKPDGNLTLRVRRHSVNGWVARFLEKVKYLEERVESTPFAKTIDPEYVKNEIIKIQLFHFKFTHAGVSARKSDWFVFRLFIRTIFFLKVILFLVAISGLLLWLYDKGVISFF